MLISNHLAGFVESIELSKIRPPKAPLRKTLEQVPDLMRSIEDNGLLHPIIVRPAGGKYEVVAGHRRYYACRKLRWARIPVHIVEADDKEAFELSLAENLQHETLSPLEIAVAFKKYVDEYGYGGTTELARRVGKSEQYVSQYLQLLKLPPQVIDKITTRVVSLTQAREFFALNEEQQLVLAKTLERETLSSRQVKDLASALKDADTFELPMDETSTYAAAERRMHEADRIMGKCLASLKVCLMRFDDLIDQTDENEFILRESLLGHRTSISHQIDSLIRLRKRVRRALI